MKIKVELKNIIDSMETNDDENRSFLNIKSGEIISLSSEEIDMADADIDNERIPKWQKELVEAAKEFEENFQDYVEIAGKYEIDEYDIMEDFCSNIEAEKLSDTFYNAIRGKGAFRRFKDALYRYNLENKWYAFYNNALKKIAIEWCKDNEIDFE